METLRTSRTVAGEIRAEMARRHVTGVQLAAQLGWTVSTTSRRLRGDQALTVDDVAAIAAVLDVPIEQLLSAAAAA